MRLMGAIGYGVSAGACAWICALVLEYSESKALGIGGIIGLLIGALLYAVKPGNQKPVSRTTRTVFQVFSLCTFLGAGCFMMGPCEKSTNYLRSSVEPTFVGYTSKDAEDLSTFAMHKNKVGITRMLLEKRIFAIEKGTRLLIMGSGSSPEFIQVNILEGKHAGKTVFVHMNYTEKSQ